MSILDEDWLTSDNIVLEEVFLSKDSSDVTRTRKYKDGSDSDNNNSASDTSGDVEDWFGGDDDVEEIRKVSYDEVLVEVTCVQLFSSVVRPVILQLKFHLLFLAKQQRWVRILVLISGSAI